MEQRSAFSLVKHLHMQLSGHLMGVDVLALPPGQAKIIKSLKQLIAELRLDVRDYEFADNRSEQLTKSEVASDRLISLRQAVLEASEYNIFGSVDVAHISAVIEQISERLV